MVAAVGPDPPTAVLFDLGGVLVDPDLARLKDNVARLYQCSVDEVDRAVFASGLKEAHDEGAFDADTFCTRVDRALGGGVSAGRLVAAWCDIFTVRAETVSLLPHLAGRCRLFIASNTDPLHAGYLRDVHRWTDLFEDAWLSFEARVAKPDPAFFRGLLAAFGLTAEETALFDDRPDNVESAARLGLRAFRDDEQDDVVRGLRSLGLLPG